MATMTIGELAQTASVHVETIRYYERAGLLPEPPRSAAGYRQYSPDAFQRLRFIKRAQQLGFTLADIRDLLRLQFAADLRCDDWESRALAKVADIERKIDELTTMKEDLLALIAACRDDCGAECTVLLEPPSKPTMAPDGETTHRESAGAVGNHDASTEEAG